MVLEIYMHAVLICNIRQTDSCKLVNFNIKPHEIFKIE